MSNSIWYPYAQHLTMPDPISVQRTEGVRLVLENGATLIDGISSWWCMVHGYNHPIMVAAIQKQLETMSHIMLGGLTHQSAKSAADAILSILPDAFDKVFFSDSGSVGVEVALKMALGYHHNLGNLRKRRFIALDRAYHGDTFAAMGVGQPNDGMHPDYCTRYFDSVFLPAPPAGFDLSEDECRPYLDSVEGIMANEAESCAALIIEPIVQGAGGFHIYSPEILKGFRALTQRYNLCLIADEVATGMCRTGKWIACDHANIVPDIIVLGKALSGGMIGHAATVATKPIFNAFLSRQSELALMHGPTFMGNPLAMAAIAASIQLAKSNNYPEKVAHLETEIRSKLQTVSAHSKVKSVRVLGAMGVIELNSESDLDGFTNYAVAQGVWLRPIGPYLYTMPSYTIKLADLHHILDTMINWVVR